MHLRVLFHCQEEPYHTTNWWFSVVNYPSPVPLLTSMAESVTKLSFLCHHHLTGVKAGGIPVFCINIYGLFEGKGLYYSLLVILHIVIHWCIHDYSELENNKTWKLLLKYYRTTERNGFVKQIETLTSDSAPDVSAAAQQTLTSDLVSGETVAALLIPCTPLRVWCW